MKKLASYVLIALAALLASCNYMFFVLPNAFAPSGLNGLCVIVMELTGINIGYLSLIINVPLAFLVYRRVSRTVAIRSFVYVLLFSLFLILLEKVQLPFRYYTENGTSRILGPLTAGVVMGCIYAILIRVGAYTGGMDFVAVLIHERHPEQSVFYINFFINIGVAVCSFFVFDYEIEPVLLCILYSFASSTMADKAMRTGRSAMRFLVVTEDYEALAREIICDLHHTATVVDAQGAYSGEKKKMIVCIVNRSQVAVFYQLIARHRGTFAVMDPVSEVFGNFKQISGKGKPNRSILDPGDKK